jgi:heme exporter protein D
MNSLLEFFAMDGHGVYIWSAYAITFAVLTLNVLQPWLARQRLVSAHARRRRRKVT